VTAFSQFGWFSNGYSKIYIDYNRDGVYDPISEQACGGFVNSPNNQMGSNFTVPSSAAFGLTGMRVVYEVFGTASSVDPCSSYFDGETENYIVNISLPPCATPPNAGTITISDTLTCPGYSVFLEDVGHDVTYNGLTFNWQYSTDGVNYSDVPSAVLDTLTFTVNSDTWFRFRTTCNGTSNGYSNIVKVSMSPPFACYGNSQAVGGLLDSSDIGAFIVADPATNNNIFTYITGGPHLNNPMAIKRRTDYTGAGVMDLYADSTYKLSIFHIIKTAYHADAKVTVFIDYNNNQTYDVPNERVFSGIADINNFYLNAEIVTPPSPALNVGTGLRIVLNNDVSPNAASDNGVGTYISGETEDYLVRFKLKPIFPTSIENNDAIQQIGVYPNPTSGIVYVGLKANEAIQFKMTVLAMTGTIIEEREIKADKGNFVTEFDMSKLAKGTYMIKIASNKGNFVRRVVVE
ncbi:MAG: T9SS type A sorting domain-containing protein, partial [Chitinophagaceae bacterium]|nr:T9SS type A sorting domain-containing protein [Chitinophagaceae bacterium]